MKKCTPNVSVIIPVYNVEQYLLPCLNSLKNQTFREFEILSIDDGSTDNSGQILDNYKSNERRLIVFHQKNQGVSEARNFGVRQAQGKYIVFLDPDDELHPEFLETLYKIITETKSDIVACDYRKGENFQDWRMMVDIAPYVSGAPFDDFVMQKLKISSTVWGKMYRKSLLKGVRFEPEISCTGEDLLYLYEVLYKAKKVLHLPLKLYFYRTRPNSVMTAPLSEKFVVGNIKFSVLFQNFINHHKFDKKIRCILKKYNTKRLFKFAVLKPSETLEKEKYYVLTRPLLRRLYQRGVYTPQFLKLKYRLKSWFFLRGK